MSLYKGKISNLTSRAIENMQSLYKYLVNMDIDIQNLFKLAAPYYGTVTGITTSALTLTGHLDGGTASFTNLQCDSGALSASNLHAVFITDGVAKITLGSASLTNLTATLVTITSLLATGVSTTNLASTGVSSTDLTATTGTITGLLVTGLSTTNLSSTGVSSTNLTANTATITNLSGVTGSYTYFGITGTLSAGSAQIGDGTNQSKFESDGTLVFEGNASVWEDINVGSTQLGAAASAPDPVTISSTTLQLRGFDGNVTLEQLYGACELQHNYKEGTDIYPHVHWMPSTANAGNVKWQMEYYFMVDGATNHTSTTIAINVSATNLAWSATRTDLGTITGTSRKIGDQLVFRFFRNPGDAADDYPDDAVVATVGFHYQIDTVGSRLIGTK